MRWTPSAPLMRKLLGGMRTAWGVVVLLAMVAFSQAACTHTSGITTEQDRLTKEQQSLVTKFANLEKTLALLQNQMAGLGLTTGSSK